MILQELCEHPGTGDDLLTKGLRDPNPETRMTALHTLSEWTAELEQPVSEISEVLLSELKKMDKTETEDELREVIRELIDGKIPDHGDGEEYLDE